MNSPNLAVQADQLRKQVAALEQQLAAERVAHVDHLMRAESAQRASAGACDRLQARLDASMDQTEIWRGRAGRLARVLELRGDEQLRAALAGLLELYEFEPGDESELEALARAFAALKAADER